MFATNLRRIAKTGFHSFWRNGSVSLAAVLIMVVALSAIGSIMFMNAVFDATLLGIQNRVGVNVSFVPEAIEQEVLELKTELEALPEVEHVGYVSREEALTNFREKHKDEQIILRSLDEVSENPFGARLDIRANEPSQYQGVADFIVDKSTSFSGDQIIDEVSFLENKVAIDRLSRVITSTETFGFALAVVLVVISVLITFNTIRLVIYVSREEIGVMRLVGASVSYIRGPFVFTGVMYGLMAGFLTLAIFYPVTLWLGDLTERFFIGINIFEYYTSNFGQIFLVVVGSGIIMGAISSYLAVMRYLKS